MWFLMHMAKTQFSKVLLLSVIILQICSKHYTYFHFSIYNPNSYGWGPYLPTLDPYKPFSAHAHHLCSYKYTNFSKKHTDHINP